jgi:hypothetical protein
VLRENAYEGNCLYGERAVLSVSEEQEVFPSRDQFPVASRQNIGNIFSLWDKAISRRCIGDIYTMKRYVENLPSVKKKRRKVQK